MYKHHEDTNLFLQNARHLIMQSLQQPGAILNASFVE